MLHLVQHLYIDPSSELLVSMPTSVNILAAGIDDFESNLQRLADGGEQVQNDINPWLAAKTPLEHIQHLRQAARFAHVDHLCCAMSCEDPSHQAQQQARYYS